MLFIKLALIVFAKTPYGAVIYSGMIQHQLYKAKRKLKERMTA